MAAIARLLEPNVETDEMHAAKYAIDAAQQAKEAPRRSINASSRATACTRSTAPA